MPLIQGSRKPVHLLLHRPEARCRSGQLNLFSSKTPGDDSWLTACCLLSDPFCLRIMTNEYMLISPKAGVAGIQMDYLPLTKAIDGQTSDAEALSAAPLGYAGLRLRAD